MLSPVITDVLLLLLCLGVLWLLLRPGTDTSLRDLLTRLDTRMDELMNRLDKLALRVDTLKTGSEQSAAVLREQLLERFEQQKRAVSEHLADGRTHLVRSFADLQHTIKQDMAEHRTVFEKRQGDAINTLQEALRSGMSTTQKQLVDNLTRNTEELGKRLEGLTASTDKRLQEISGQVDKRLSEGFEKTTSTFADVLKRLAVIDEAQKKITELSSNVVSLQEVLSDKRSRGAFGEVQLAALVRNVMPEANFELQYTLPNERRADCVLKLPQPTGMVAIDAKFPLESYQRMTDIDRPESERKTAERQFKQDIRKHIHDIADRYIIPGVTSDGAVMFIPAEAVFAEIQAHHVDLVEEANSKRVWMVSPTTLWAILNTARAVLKDAATREQVHIIQEHLGLLGKDFERFQKRMDGLTRHVEQAHKDAQDVNISARKISSRFEKIEKVELDGEETALLDVDKNDVSS